jgi:hypothetical protein
MKRNVFGEPITHDGRLILGVNQIQLLEILFHLPDQTVASKTKWARLAAPAKEQGFWSKYESIGRIPVTLLSMRSQGASCVCSLTIRGNQLLEGNIPAWIWGIGPYHPEYSFP